MTMEILEGPKVERRPEAPYVGVRMVTPFRGMLGVRDKLLDEVMDFAETSELAVVEYGFLRLLVVDMQGDMEIEVGVKTRKRTDFAGRIESGVLPAGNYATLSYRGVGTAANRAIQEWTAAEGLALDKSESPAGDRFGCRYEAYLTDPAVESHKKKWTIQLAFRLAD